MYDVTIHRIATLQQQAAAAAAAGHDYQQHGYYDYSSYYQQANVAGRITACCQYQFLLG